MGIVTLAEYKLVGGIGYTGDDEVLQVLIDQATQIVEDFVGYGVTSQARTEVYRATDKPYLYLKSKPVTTVTSVEYASGISGGDQVWTTLGTGSYWCDTERGILHRDTVGDSYWGDVGLFDGSHWRVAYTAGDDNASIESTTMQLIDMLYANRRRNQSLQSEGIGGVSWASMTVAEQQAWFRMKLGKYKRVSF